MFRLRLFLLNIIQIEHFESVKLNLMLAYLITSLSFATIAWIRKLSKFSLNERGVTQLHYVYSKCPVTECIYVRCSLPTKQAICLSFLLKRFPFGLFLVHLQESLESHDSLLIFIFLPSVIKQLLQFHQFFIQRSLSIY